MGFLGFSVPTGLAVGFDSDRHEFAGATGSSRGNMRFGRVYGPYALPKAHTSGASALKSLALLLLGHGLVRIIIQTIQGHDDGADDIAHVAGRALEVADG
ncbi:MAG: hypothetical protein ACI8TQ_001193 [Planctomycetota bacterium]|jgi:hypothetical protein